MREGIAIQNVEVHHTVVTGKQLNIMNKSSK